MNKPIFLKNQMVELTEIGKRKLDNIHFWDVFPFFEGTLFIVEFVEVTENLEYRYHFTKLGNDDIHFMITESFIDCFVLFNLGVNNE